MWFGMRLDSDLPRTYSGAQYVRGTAETPCITFCQILDLLGVSERRSNKSAFRSDVRVPTPTPKLSLERQNYRGNAAMWWILYMSCKVGWNLFSSCVTHCKGSHRGFPSGFPRLVPETMDTDTGFRRVWSAEYQGYVYEMGKILNADPTRIQARSLLEVASFFHLSYWLQTQMVLSCLSIYRCDNCTLCIGVMKWLRVFFHVSTDRVLPLKVGTCALKSAAGGARSCAVFRSLPDLGCRPCYLNIGSGALRGSAIYALRSTGFCGSPASPTRCRALHCPVC